MIAAPRPTAALSAPGLAPPRACIKAHRPRPTPCATTCNARIAAKCTARSHAWSHALTHTHPEAYAYTRDGHQQQTFATTTELQEDDRCSTTDQQERNKTRPQQYHCTPRTNTGARSRHGSRAQIQRSWESPTGGPPSAGPQVQAAGRKCRAGAKMAAWECAAASHRATQAPLSPPTPSLAATTGHPNCTASSRTSPLWERRGCNATFFLHLPPRPRRRRSDHD